ncbi:MAG: hypothetical protein WC505_07905 [Patescibacteria group bacterium]
MNQHSAEKVPKKKPQPKGGSRKGIPNKITTDLKNMVFGALHAGGGQKWLERQRDENPVAFMTLLGKFVPKDVNVGGQVDNPIVTTVKLVAMNASDDQPSQ